MLPRPQSAADSTQDAPEITPRAGWAASGLEAPAGSRPWAVAGSPVRRIRDSGRGRAVLNIAIILHVGGAGLADLDLPPRLCTCLPARTQHDVARLDAHWPRHKAPSSNGRPPRLENYPILAYYVQRVKVVCRNAPPFRHHDAAATPIRTALVTPRYDI